MKVLIDATALPAQRVGAGHYIVELLQALASTDVDLNVMCKARDATELSKIATVHIAKPSSRPARLAWQSTVLPVRVRKAAPDVFHGPHYTLPAGIGCPGVVTFHDPTFFTMPEVHERAKVAYFTRLARVGVKRAARVIAVSAYAGRGAIEHAGASADQVDVVPLGVDHVRYHPNPPSADARLLRHLGIDGPYVLWVGALEPRKDVPTLLDAFAKFVAPDFDHRLVLVGPPAWGAAAIEQSIIQARLGDRILRTGYVTDDEKVALYRGATLLAYPSLAEGFGLPVLEAMACGTPVITTTGSACEEVGGGAVRTVPPGSVDALGSALTELLSSDSERAKLSAAGIERASEFSWENTAAATVQSYRRALA